MNRTFSLHPLSLVLGLVFGVLVLISMSQVGTANQNLVVSYGPNPRDMVQISGGVPYTVPSGKLFVLTGIGATTENINSRVVLSVNGQQQAYGVESAVQSVPPGFTVAASSTISLADLQGYWLPSFRAWGYLAPQ